MLVSDFGLSKELTETSTSTSYVQGMTAYIDPQCFKDSIYKRSTKSDVYSYGIILWKISSGLKPFTSLSGMSVAIYIFQGDRERPIEGTPSQYVELYTNCWDDNPDKRPEMKSVLSILNQLISEPENFHNSMTVPSKGWLEKALSEQYINYYDYNQFSNLEIVDEIFKKANWKNHEVTLRMLSYHSNITESDDKEFVIKV